MALACPQTIAATPVTWALAGRGTAAARIWGRCRSDDYAVVGADSLVAVVAGEPEDRVSTLGVPVSLLLTPAMAWMAAKIR